MISVAILILIIMTFLCLYRAVAGPSVADRVVAINVIGTKTVAIIALVSFAFEQQFYLDVAMVYALINFLATIGISRYVEKGRLG